MCSVVRRSCTAPFISWKSEGGAPVSLIYSLVKDAAKYLEWREGEPKLVDRQWLEVSGRMQELAADGMKVSWCDPEKLETRLLKGSVVIYEVDKPTRVRCRIVRRDGLVLIGKKQSDPTP